MRAGFIAYHYPHAGYRDEFAGRVEGVARIFRTAPGCLSADVWLGEDGSVTSIVRMESPEALATAFTTLQSAESRQAYEAEFGPDTPGEDDGTDAERFGRPHVVHQFAGL